MDKKGDVSVVEDLFEYFFKIMIIISVFLICFLLIHSAINKSVDMFDAESHLFIYRLMNSKGGISYYNPQINRIYPGVIDFNRFISDNFPEELEKTINYPEEHIAAEITLYDENNIELSKVYFKKKAYQKWLPISRTNAGGPGSAKSLERSFYVLIKNKGALALRQLSLDSEYGKLDASQMAQIQKKKEYYSKDTFENSMLVPGKLVINVIIPNS